MKRRNNIFLISLPRSGSTWYSKRLAKLYNLNLLHEPFRVILGANWGKDKASDASKGDLEYLLDWLNKQNNTIIKETNWINNLDFLEKKLDSYMFVHLRRNLGAVFDSHVRITDVYRAWNYKERIKSFYKISKGEYNGIYNRAKEVKIKNSNDLSLLFAHLFVQELVLINRVDSQVVYENAVHNFLNSKFLNVFSSFKLKDISISGIDNVKQNYSLHGTKNIINPYSWINNYDTSDLDVMRHILGDKEKIVFKEESERHINKFSKIPKISYVLNPEIKYAVSNRVVIAEEFICFLNELIKAGVVDPHKALAISSSWHTMFVKNGHFFPIKPNMPIVLISPLGALAYCKYKKGKLPAIKFYNELAKKKPCIEEKAMNFGENIGSLTLPGKYRSFYDYYDLYGNIKELSLNENHKSYIVGGSYKDEPEDLELSRQQLIPKIYRDYETGFRIQNDNHCKINFSEIIDMIKSKKNHQELFCALCKA